MSSPGIQWSLRIFSVLRGFELGQSSDRKRCATARFLFHFFFTNVSSLDERQNALMRLIFFHSKHESVFYTHPR